MDPSKIINSIINGDIAQMPVLVKEALDEGVGPEEILDKALIAGMSVVGQRFKTNEIFVPEVLIAAKAMHAGLDVLEPLLAESGVEPKGKVVIGTVKGDLHDIGKNLVSMMFKGAGFSVVDLGIDVPPDVFANRVDQEKPNIVAMSSLLTTSMPSMKETIGLLRVKLSGSDTKIMIGGAPVTQDYADEIGADGYAQDASSAVDKAKELLRL